MDAVASRVQCFADLTFALANAAPTLLAFCRNIFYCEVATSLIGDRAAQKAAPRFNCSFTLEKL